MELDHDGAFDSCSHGLASNMSRVSVVQHLTNVWESINSIPGGRNQSLSFKELVPG